MSRLATMLGIAISLILTVLVVLLAIIVNTIASAILGLIFERSPDAI